MNKYIPPEWDYQWEDHRLPLSEENQIRLKELYAATMELVMEFLMDNKINLGKKDILQMAFLNLFDEHSSLDYWKIINAKSTN